MVGARAGGGGEQQVAQIGGEHPHRFLLGRIPQPQPQIDAEVDLDLGAPRPARGVDQPFVAGPPTIADAEAVHDPQLVGAGAGTRRRRIFRLDGDVQNLLFLGAEQRQNAMRRHLRQLLGEIEIVAEFGAGFSLAVAHLRSEAADRPHLLAQRADQVGVLGKALDQDRAGAVERGGDIGDLLFGIDEARRRDRRIVFRVRQQQIGERLQAGLLGDLGLGAALRLERQIDVFEPALAVGGADRGFERVVELALLADRIEDDGAPLLQLAQIAQALVERAQLRVIERAGRFLAIAGDERHGRAAVEQRHRGRDLLVADAEFLRDLSVNGSRHARTFAKKWLRKSGTDAAARSRGRVYGRRDIDSSTPADDRERTGTPDATPRRSVAGDVIRIGANQALLPGCPSERLIDPVLPAGSGFLEVFEHVLIDAQRDQLFHIGERRSLGSGFGRLRRRRLECRFGRLPRVDWSSCSLTGHRSSCTSSVTRALT